MNKCTLLLGIISFLLLVNSGFSQTTLYTQNFGVSPSSGFPSGWSSSSGSATWTMSSSFASSGYPGASGGLYVASTGPTAGAVDTLYFSGISTVGYSNITVFWGEMKSTGQTSYAAVEWSSDGIIWHYIPYIDVFGYNVWALVNGGGGLLLTSGAEGVTNLRFRWRATVSAPQSTLNIDDFIVQGASTSPPAKIAIVSVNGGTNPDSCHSFNVVVQTLDANGQPVNVTSTSTVTLTKHTGTGNGVILGGSDTISAGQGSCTINVSYSNTGTGVSLLATCGTLTPDTSSVFDVLLCGFCSSTINYSGQLYNSVLIGTQCWMKENLNVGTMINYISDGDQSNNSTLEKYCYSNVASNCVSYGGLYQWAELVQYYGGATNSSTFSPPLTGNVQGICPPNWHIPNTTEWTTLETYLGSTAGNDMRETGTTYWSYNSSSYIATNSSGFSARGGGSCNSMGSYSRKSQANFWSLNDLINQPIYADYILLANNIPNMYVLSGSNGTTKTYGMSVRCIFDYTTLTGIPHDVINSDEFINIYPNPAKNYINLKFQNSDINNAEIKIYDIPGNLVYSEIYNSRGTKKIKTINTGNLQTGNYILQVNWGNTKYSKKIVIIK